MKKLILAAFVATAIALGANATDSHDKVQLWEGGPYWATTNVGAENPEDYGYYFWWGDTVGYRRENGAWVAVDGSSSNFSFTDGNTPTYGKDNSALLSAGYIDSTGNLVAEHDAATAHWGGGWRMPTSDEFAALISNCTTTWITTNGVNGRLVTGKDEYANRSIFLPAAGYGNGTGIASPGNDCNHYSSSPDSGNSYKALFLGSNPSVYQQISYYRNLGMPVRPVWQPAQQIDLSTLTDNYRAANGDVLTGTTTYNVTIPGGATVTINGISVTGGGGGSVPAPAFAEGGESVTTKFEKKAGEGNVWTITAFAEMSNASRGTDVTDGQIKVYSADTLEALESATTPAAGAIVKETKSAVKATVEVPAPSGKDSQFFKVKFGE